MSGPTWPGCRRPIGAMRGRRYLAVVPTQLDRALDQPDLGEALRALDAVLVGGSALDPSLRSRAEQADINVVASYGMTETCGGCVYDGLPLDGVSVSVEPATQRIRIASVTNFSGYRLRPDLTSTTLNDGTLITQDRGSVVQRRPASDPGPGGRPRDHRWHQCRSGRTRARLHVVAGIGRRGAAWSSPCPMFDGDTRSSRSRTAPVRRRNCVLISREGCRDMRHLESLSTSAPCPERPPGRSTGSGWPRIWRVARRPRITDVDRRGRPAVTHPGAMDSRCSAEDAASRCFAGGRRPAELPSSKAPSRAGGHCSP